VLSITSKQVAVTLLAPRPSVKVKYQPLSVNPYSLFHLFTATIHRNLIRRSVVVKGQPGTGYNYKLHAFVGQLVT